MTKKTILITGATGNLGSEVTRKMLDSGHQVIGTILPPSKSEIGEANLFPCDLTSEKDTENLFAELRTKYDRIDAVIMLVGGFGMGNVREASSSDLLKMLNLNLITAFHTAQKAINWMNETGGGNLIFVGAKPALDGGAAEVLPYAISKNAVIKLSEIINEDKANQNIQSSVIIPSIIDTAPNRSSMPDADYSDWVTPEQIAESLLFLVSDVSKPLRKTILRIYNNA